MFWFNNKNKQEIKTLDRTDVIKFYWMNRNYNRLSDTFGVITKDFKNCLKSIKKKYDKSYTILASEKTNSIVVVKEDFLEKYVVLNNFEDLLHTEYKFKQYI